MARLLALAFVVACSAGEVTTSAPARGREPPAAAREEASPRDATLELLVLSVRESGDVSDRCELIVNLAFDERSAFGFGGGGDYWVVRIEPSAGGTLAAELRHVGAQWSGALPPPSSIRGRQLVARRGLTPARIKDSIATLDGLFATVAHDEVRGPSSCSYARRLLDALGISAPELDVRPTGWDWVPPKPQ